jgi:protein-S-isoprenylcysteine O-methyltransferase Ste14
MGLAIRNIVFTLIVPGSGGVLVPWLIMTARGATPVPVAWPAVLVVGIGAALYAWCIAAFAIVGRGTPGPWDAPRRVVAVGPYRRVRNPIYIAALLVVVGQAWLFGSLPVLIYAGLLGVGFHLFVIAHEEPALIERFDGEYAAYRSRVPRWIPRLPGPSRS